MVRLTQKYIDDNAKTSSSPWLVMRCINPYCDDSSGHLYYNTETGFYHCFKCLLRGFLNKREEYPFFKKKSGFEGKLPDGCLPINFTDKGKILKEVKRYLIKRGITEKDVKYYNLHYGYSGNLAKRVIFPFYRENKLVYYCARDITGESERKYINSTGKKEIYNIEVASNYSEVVIVEGIIDAIMTGKDAISLLGKTISNYQIELLKKYEIKDVNILLDSTVKKQEICELAGRLKKYMRKVDILELPYGDPGSVKLRTINEIRGWRTLKREEYDTLQVLKKMKLKF
jgi:hypothetical protein